MSWMVSVREAFSFQVLLNPTTQAVKDTGEVQPRSVAAESRKLNAGLYWTIGPAHAQLGPGLRWRESGMGGLWIAVF